MGDRFGRVGEGALFFYFAGGAVEGSKGGAGEGAPDTDSLDSGGGEFFDGEVCAVEAREDVDGFGDGAADFADGLEIGEPRRVEDICPCLGEGLQAADCVVEIRPVVKEVFGASG